MSVLVLKLIDYNSTYAMSKCNLKNCVWEFDTFRGTVPTEVVFRSALEKCMQRNIIMLIPCQFLVSEQSMLITLQAAFAPQEHFGTASS